MKRIYISGPMSGIAEHNFPAFNAEAARLRAMGYEVVNPAEMNVGSQDDWHACLRADIKALCDCDTIALMPGWENSKGAHLEVHVAHRLGIAVVQVGAISRVVREGRDFDVKFGDGEPGNMGKP